MWQPPGAEAGTWAGSQWLHSKAWAHGGHPILPGGLQCQVLLLRGGGSCGRIDDIRSPRKATKLLNLGKLLEILLLLLLQLKLGSVNSLQKKRKFKF